MLFDADDEGELRREARRIQFRDLIFLPPFELRRYLKSEIDDLYEECKTQYTLKHQIEVKGKQLAESE